METQTKTFYEVERAMKDIGTLIYKRAVEALALALVDVESEIPRLMEALVGEQMESSTLEAGTISNSDKLHIGKGATRRAFIKGRAGNVYESNIDLLNSTFEYGVDTDVVKGFATHEFGDTRPITPKMRGFFWAKYYETGKDMWRGLALTKRTTITYPKRPVLEPAFEQFEQEEMQPLLNQIFIRMAIAFNAN